MKLSNPGVNIEEDFKKHLSDICNYTGIRFQSLKSPPISCFQSFDFRWFAPSRWDETRSGALHVDQWLNLKLFVSQPTQRKLRPYEVYSPLLANKPDNLRHILPIVEIMMVLSASTAVCERSFSAMGLKTNMKQETSDGCVNCQS